MAATCASQDNERSVSLESVNFRGHFIRHQNYELWRAGSAIQKRAK
ncbi:MAG: AbfB domain-containing protein [Acidobacteriota bacterium]|nr:AbfB domain-containing protein [Acidobacteriota bacterium]